jgi:asparagine synthase (glutamine-hydrolysing)
VSGIVGLFQRDGAPVDRELLRAMTGFLAFRGPDACETWSEGAIGFGHTMLRTTRESQSERQPACLDGRLWITADARIDCRADLRKKLADAGRKVSPERTDPELILHAYAAWEENCLQHLRGDFAFAIWDQHRKELFCARDHFGIKPFYYSEVGGTFIFSNTLNCVRLLPDVSDELNDDAVLDFLIVGFNCDNSATTFKAIRRIPPAHFLKAAAEGVCVSRYYSLPTDGRIRYKREEDYVEHFQVVFKQAVADRLRAKRVGVFLSGGLDSPAIAAAARQIAPTVDLRAYTCVYESLIPDQEGRFAREVAKFLRIPIRFFPMDHLKPFPGDDIVESAWPEPIEDPFAAGPCHELQAIAADCPVVLSGDGADDIMDFQMWPYTRNLFRRRDWASLFRELPAFLRVRRFPWRGLWRRAQRLLRKGPLTTVKPDWIAETWAPTANMEDRWEARTSTPDSRMHRILPRAYTALGLPCWTFLFEVQDPGFTRFPIEVGYPFLDLRVVEYLFALPPFPWFFKKNLLRRAMTGRLPKSILRRPKTPLAAEPLLAHIKADHLSTSLNVPWNQELDRYVCRSKLRSVSAQMSPESARLEIRPFCLNFWLQGVRAAQYNVTRCCAPEEPVCRSPQGSLAKSPIRPPD